MIPAAVQNTERTAAQMVTARKLLNNLMADIAGKITRAEISKDPTRFMAITMTTVVTTARIRLYIDTQHRCSNRSGVNYRELLQKLLDALDLMADGTVLAATIVVSLSSDKKYGEEQGKHQQRCPAGGGKTCFFRHVLLPPLKFMSTTLCAVAVLTNAVQDCLENI